MQIAVANGSHMMTITSNGKVIKRYPISMGKASTPSWSGRFVIMERLPATIFDTLDAGPGGYRVAVQYAERLTWSGMFLHSAPWSVYAQGHMNVSHGCVNVGPSNAKWLFNNSLVGDPVTVSASDVFEFLAHQRGDRTVVRLSDRESGLSARTIARRLSSVSGFYAYLVARGDTAVTVNPVPRGLQTRRTSGRARTVPLVRVPRTLPRILSPDEVDALIA